MNKKWPPLGKIVSGAAKKPYIIGGFNVFSQYDARAVVRAAEKADAPVLLMLNKQAVAMMEIQQWAETLRGLAKRAKVPVLVHLDHTTDLAKIKEACRAGFDSVMYDGSQLSLEENIRNTRQVVKMAHGAGIMVEAEIGAVGYGDGTQDGYKARLSNPEEAGRFAEETGLDWLAVSVGNVHRMEEQTTAINFELLNKIEKVVDKPLVLHGSTGITDEDMRKLRNTKVAKVNIGTALRMAFGKTLREEVNNNPKVFDQLTLLEKPLEAVEEVAFQKMKLLGLTDAK